MERALDAKLASNGRLVLPKKVREALGITGSGTVVFSIDGDQVKLSSIQQSVRRAQDLYRLYATKDHTVDDFIAERRAEAARDDQS